MLKSLSNDIKYCYGRAMESALRALETADPALKAHHEAMEKDWLRLADNYEFSQQLGRQLLDRESKFTSRGNWQPVASAPFDRHIEIAVINSAIPHTLAFPCRRILRGWLNAETGEKLEVHPTHWRDWITSHLPSAQIQVPAESSRSAS